MKKCIMEFKKMEIQDEIQSNIVNEGKITSINGPIIKVNGFINQRIGDMVDIGRDFHLIGEIVKIIEDISIIQCFEDTSSLKLNDVVINFQYPLSMELGPGLLNSIYDGIQRPLVEIAKICGSFIKRGIKVEPLDRTKKWNFKAIAEKGMCLQPGDLIGKVTEFYIEHLIMVPIGISGNVIEINCGEMTVEDIICEIQEENGTIHKLNMIQRWPIRKPRPYLERFLPDKPLVTGTRVFDLLFPIARGGAVAIPGGFGTGKTVVQHSLAKYASADIIVYIGCGERGNEMADLLEQFPKLVDPVYNKPLMQRTVMIANTSNMPVSAREASIFAGITIAEYWRDQGKNVLLLADSTSRWAEALRELSGRLEEMPTEGGYPAYLSSRLSAFYERAGSVSTIGTPSRKGSVTIVGAVSPPSGDFSEPVTKNTKRFIKAFWALDARLAYSRHYPSINWNDSYSLYDNLDRYWKDSIESGWQESRVEVSKILSKAGELENIVQLIGKESLPPEQQLIVLSADIIKNAFLIQNAFDSIDSYCSPKKTMKLIKIILKFHLESLNLISKGVPFFRISEMECINDIKRIRLDISNDDDEGFKKVVEKTAQEFLRTQRIYSDLF
jgi:V/A-type H+/Na+-transporting ATPase subunit A